MDLQPDDRLGVRGRREDVGIPKENVRLVSPYIGGGFGGKLFIRADALLAALGARLAKRPVKVALTRPIMINNTTHRPATIQRIRIGGTDGKITAIAHERWSGDLRAAARRRPRCKRACSTQVRIGHDCNPARGTRSGGSRGTVKPRVRRPE